MIPKRIQMHRRKGGWRRDHPDAVIVDRRTEWGNPFEIGRPGVPDAACAVALFEAAILLCDHFDRAAAHPMLSAALSDELGGIPRVETIVRHLRGRDLACWCPLDQPCHADVLLRLANAEPCS